MCTIDFVMGRIAARIFTICGLIQRLPLSFFLLYAVGVSRLLGRVSKFFSANRAKNHILRRHPPPHQFVTVVIVIAIETVFSHDLLRGF